jgi:hypothetical protein
VSADDDPAAAEASLWARMLGAASMGAGVVAAAVLYPAAIGADVHPMGPDMFAYIWQTRFVGEGALAEIGTRPGIPLLGSVLSGFGVTPQAEAPLLLGPVLAVTLALAIAGGLRLAFRSGPWSIGVVTFAIALWGGSITLSLGYLANELSLVAFVAALLSVALPGGRSLARRIGACAAAIAAGIAHPGFLPLYLTIAATWLLVSVPRSVRTRRSNPWWADPAVAFSAAVAIATGVTALVVFGVMGLALSDLTNLATETRDLTPKVPPVLKIIGRGKPVLVRAAIGAAAAWRLRRPSSRDLTRAGVAWVLCATVWGLATLVVSSLPGHRALLVVLPLPAAAGLGIVWVAATALRFAGGSGGAPERRSVGVAVAAVVAIAVVVGGSALIAAPGLDTLRTRGQEHVRGGPARLLASYAATVRPTTPFVVFTSPATDPGARAWRGRQNQVRAYVPTELIGSTFVVVGTLEGPDGLTPVPLRAGSATAKLASEQSWVGGGPALRDGAIVAVSRVLGGHQLWTAIADVPDAVVTPDLAVLRGPRTTPAVMTDPVAVPSGTFVVRALACLLGLAALGGGYGVAAVRGARGTLLDASAIAPAIGTVVVVLTALVVGLGGGEPGGGVGIAAVAGVALSGYVLAWRVRAFTAARSG